MVLHCTTCHRAAPEEHWRHAAWINGTQYIECPNRDCKVLLKSQQPGNKATTDGRRTKLLQ